MRSSNASLNHVPHFTETRKANSMSTARRRGDPGSRRFFLLRDSRCGRPALLDQRPIEDPNQLPFHTPAPLFRESDHTQSTASDGAEQPTQFIGRIGSRALLVARLSSLCRRVNTHRSKGRLQQSPKSELRAVEGGKPCRHGPKPSAGRASSEADKTPSVYLTDPHKGLRTADSGVAVRNRQETRAACRSNADSRTKRRRAGSGDVSS